MEYPLFLRVEAGRVLHLQYLIEAVELDDPPRRLRVSMSGGIDSILEGPAATRARKRLDLIAPYVDETDVPTVTNVRNTSPKSPKTRPKRRGG